MTYSPLINVIDLEWEAARPPSSRIIEIGLTVIDASARKIVKTYSYPISYTNPGNIKSFMNSLGNGFICPSAASTIMSRLADERAKDFVTPEIQDLTGWSQKKLNKQGEPLLKVLERLSIKHGAKNRICVVDCADEFDLFGEDNPFGNNIINISNLFRIKTNQFKGVSLLEMVNHYGLSFKGRQHKASVDSEAIAQIFLELIK